MEGKEELLKLAHKQLDQAAKLLNAAGEELLAEGFGREGQSRRSGPSPPPALAGAPGGLAAPGAHVNLYFSVMMASPVEVAVNSPSRWD